MAAGDDCLKIGYTVTKEDRPDDYMSGHCDCCHDCCCWTTITGMCCEKKCCPHPTGAVLYGGDLFADLQGGVLNNHSAGFFINDDFRQDPTGYGVSGRAGDLFSPAGGGGQMPLGLVSIVDDAGMEYMSEVDYAHNTNSVWTDMHVFPVVIDAGMAYNEQLCGGSIDAEYGGWNAPTGPSGWVDVMYDGIDMGVDRDTPTPYTAPTAAATAPIVGHSMVTTVHWGYWTTLTSKPEYGAPTAMVQATAVPTHAIATAQTTLEAGGWQYTSYEWTNIPAHTTLTSWNATALTWVTHEKETEKTRDTPTPVIETHVVVVTPDYSPNTFSAHPTQAPKTYGFGYRSNMDGYYYEPFVSIKMWRAGVGTNQTTSSHTNYYLLCTNGEEYKRLGTGSAVSENDFTVGYPFHPAGNAGVASSHGSYLIDNNFISEWPTIYIPTERDCWQIAETVTADCNIGGVYQNGLWDFAVPDENGWIDYDPEKIGPDITGNENEHWTKDRRRVFKFVTGTNYSLSPYHEVWRHTSPYQQWSVGATDAGERFWPIDFHGCYQQELMSNHMQAESYCTNLDGDGVQTDWVVMGQNTGTNLEWYLRYGRRTGGLYAGEEDGWQIFSQRSFLEAANNYIKSRLGGGWRMARANELIPDFEAPKSGCRQICTHEKIDDDGAIVPHPYIGQVEGTKQGRSGDANSQWKIVVTSATGETNFHSPTWDGANLGDFFEDQAAAGMAGHTGQTNYLGEREKCSIPDTAFLGGFEGCGEFTGEHKMGYWEMVNGSVSREALILGNQNGDVGWGNQGEGGYDNGGNIRWPCNPAVEETQTTSIIKNSAVLTAVTTFALSEPGERLTAATIADAGYTYALTDGFFQWQEIYTNTHVTNVQTYNVSAGLAVDMTTTETSDGDGNIILTPTPLGVADTQTPAYADTYTITYSYGAQNTPITLNSTPTPTWTGFVMTAKAEKGDGTLTKLTNKTTFKTEWELKNEVHPIRKNFENLGLYRGRYWGRRFSDWCTINRGCGHEDWVKEQKLGLFETPFHAGKPCVSCNEGAYITGTKYHSILNEAVYTEEDQVYEKARCTYSNFAWFDFNGMGADPLYGLLSHGRRWDGKPPHSANISLYFDYMYGCNSIYSIYSYLDEHTILSKDGANKIADLYNIAFKDYVYDSTPDLNPTYSWNGYWAHSAINQRMEHTNPDKGQVWTDEFNGVGVDFSWINDPAGFFNVSKELYDESRCCKNGEKETTGYWPPGREEIAGGKTGMSCKNYWNDERGFCFQSVEKEVELGCKTGYFWGVLDGGVYWNDVLQIDEDKFEGNKDANYSLGFGMEYKGSTLTGNTDDGDSRFLKEFLKTECCDENGDNLPDEVATISATVKLSLGDCSPHGRMMITCPGQTEDAGCYNYGTHRIYTGDVDGGVWGTSGKTYIVGMKGTDCACAPTGNEDCDDDAPVEPPLPEVAPVSFNVYKPIWSSSPFPAAGWPSFGTAYNGSYKEGGGTVGHSQLGTWNGFETYTLFVETGRSWAGITNYSNGTNTVASATIGYQNIFYASDPNPYITAGDTAAVDQLKLSEQDVFGSQLLDAIDQGHRFYSLTNTEPYIPIELNSYQDVNQKNIYVIQIGNPGASNPYTAQ